MSGTEAHCHQPSLVDASAAAGDPSRKRRREDDETASANTAQTCFPDGLHSIFSFLSLREFVAASRCCLHWRDAASTQPPLCRSPGRIDTTAVTKIADSRAARHIDQLDVKCRQSELSSVLSLCCRLPHLTSLDLAVQADDEDDEEEDEEADSYSESTWGADEEQTPQQMPDTLRKLEVSFYSERFPVMKWSLVDSLFARLCHSNTPPLTSLRIEIDAADGLELTTQMPVSTLSRLLVLKDSLTSLVFAYESARFDDEDEDERGPGRWTQEHIDVFRQLTRLEKLDPFNGRWSDEELIMLCAEPAPAHLRILRLDGPTTQAGGDALSRLPLTETEFRFYHVGDVEALSFLGRIPTLRGLKLGDILTPESPDDIDAIVDLMAGCTRCTSLSTPHWTTNAHFCRFLPPMVHLRELSVYTNNGIGVAEFGGLSFASAVSTLAHTLERLQIFFHQSGSPGPLTELHHLHSLRSLRQLELWMSVSSATPAAERDQASGEFDTKQPTTFRRDRWPHMVEARVVLLPH